MPTTRYTVALPDAMAAKLADPDNGITVVDRLRLLATLYVESKTASLTPRETARGRERREGAERQVSKAREALLADLDLYRDKNGRKVRSPDDKYDLTWALAYRTRRETLRGSPGIPPDPVEYNASLAEDEERREKLYRDAGIEPPEIEMPRDLDKGTYDAWDRYQARLRAAAAAAPVEVAKPADAGKMTAHVEALLNQPKQEN